MKKSPKSRVGLLIVISGIFLLAIIGLSLNSGELFSGALSVNPLGLKQKQQPLIKTPLVKPVTDPVQSFINTSVPSTPVTEKIVFAINKDFADQYPDWQDRANRIVTDLNTGFAKTTKKRFEIGKFVTYEFGAGESPYPAIETLINDPATFSIPGNVSTCNVGRVLIYLVANDQVPFENPGGGNNYMSSLNGVYGFAIITERLTKSTMLKETMPYFDDLESFYWTSLKLVAHELGHSLGLALPDWYNYEYEDLTAVPPALPPYSLNQRFPMDPQTNPGGTSLIHYPDKLWEFSDLNAFIINHGVCKSLTTEQIKLATPDTVIVRVKDTANNPVPNAKVDVYGIDNQYRRYGNSDPSYFVLKLSVTTDASGNAVIKTPRELTLIPPVFGVFDTEIVKVSKDGKYGGSFLSTYDLQRTRLLENKTTHYLDINVN